MGRRASIALTCAIAGVTMSLAGYWHDLFLGGVSVFYLMIMVQQFFGSGSYSIIGPYMAEIWPSRLRASGMGLAYGAGNLGKFIGPAGLALIAGSSNLVSPQATRRRADPGDELLRRLVCPGARGGVVHRLRDARPHDRRDRQRLDRRQVALNGGGQDAGRLARCFINSFHNTSAVIANEANLWFSNLARFQFDLRRADRRTARRAE